ncbi:MAG: hypothetical protein JXR73_03770 [Candidatus Omnitrophica bacterium]|nr:hypothetical protein [Candidatus Omnitrophota bacterium]
MYADKDNKQTAAPAHRLKRLLERDSVFFVCIFTLLALAACWPILFHPARHLSVMPTADKGANLWNLWWVYYALFERGISPLRCDMIFIPWGCDLRCHTLSIANGLIASPVTGRLGPSIAYNLLFLVWTLLTGCFAAMWAQRFGASRWTAVMAGVIAAFGPYRWGHQNHLNLFSTPWLFLAFYFCERSVESKNIRYAAAIALAWILALFTDWYYGLFVGFYLTIRACLLILTHRSAGSVSWALKFWIAPAIVVYLAVFSYFFGAPALENYVDSVPMKFSAFWSMDLMHFVLPLWLLPHFPLLQQNEEFGFHPGFVWMLLPLVFYRFAGGSQKGRANRTFLLTTAGVFFLFSLGPVLMWNAHPVRIFYGIPVFLPASVFELIPGLTVIRVYARFAYIGFTACLLLGLLGLQNWMLVRGWRRRTGMVYLILAGFFFLETGWRFPRMVDYPSPPLFFSESPKPVLELPFEPSIYGGLHLYHQTLHKQPIFVAEFSRLGKYRQKYLEDFPALPLLNRAACGENLPADPEFDREFFCRELHRLGQAHIILGALESGESNSEALRDSLQNVLRLCQKDGALNPLEN